MYDKKPIIDAHTHTVASGHAYSSLQEMAKAASERGIAVLGITEHGPAVPGSCPTLYFRNAHCIPRNMYGVHLLIGCEIDILDTEGHLDVDDKVISYLDLRIAGIHKVCWQGGTKEANTEGLVKVIRNPHIDIISHPGDDTCDLDFEPIVDAAKEAGTLLEINNHTLAPFRGRVAAVAHNLEILRLCKAKQVPIILGSDAHISFMIGDYSRIFPLLEETDFPEELIANYHPELFWDVVGRHYRRP